VRKYVVRRKIPGKDGKPDRFKSPKIQRLITPVKKSRKKARLALKRERYTKATSEAAEYQKLLAQRRQTARAALLSKKRAGTSEKKSVKAAKPTTTKKQ
jgi:small subunit ribosomal protein S6e